MNSVAKMIAFALMILGIAGMAQGKATEDVRTKNPAVTAPAVTALMMPPGIVYGYGNFWPMLPYLNVEQWKHYEDLMKEYADKMRPLQQEMLTHRLELDALSRIPTTVKKDLHDLAASIAALYTRMEQEADDMGHRLREHLGIILHPALLRLHVRPVNLDGLVPIYPDGLEPKPAGASKK